MWFARGTDEPATSSKLLRFSLDSEQDHCGGTSYEGRNTPLETAKTARKRCRGNEKKELCIVSILLWINTERIKETIEAIGKT